jgi:hypothetical protein
MVEIMMVNTKKKGWLSLSSTTAVMLATIILLGGIKPLFAFSSLQMPGMMDENMNLSSKTCINNIGQYTNANNTQDWKDPENNVKIHFTYLPEYPLPENITKLIFMYKIYKLEAI